MVMRRLLHQGSRYTIRSLALRIYGLSNYVLMIDYLIRISVVRSVV